MEKIIFDKNRSTGTTVLQDNNCPISGNGCPMATRSVDQEANKSLSTAGLPVLEEAESIAVISNLSGFSLSVEVVTSTGSKKFDVFIKKGGLCWSLTSSMGHSLDLRGDVCKHNKYGKRADLTILLSYFVRRLAGVKVEVNTNDKWIKKSVSSFREPLWKS